MNIKYKVVNKDEVKVNDIIGYNIFKNHTEIAVADSENIAIIKINNNDIEYLYENGKCIYTNNYITKRCDEGERYWFIDECGVVMYTEEFFTHRDDLRFENDNYYMTEESCEQQAKKDKFIKQINKKIKELNAGWVANWSDSGEEKGFVDTHHGRDGIEIRYDIFRCYQLPNLFEWMKNKNVFDEIKRLYEDEIYFILGINDGRN